MIARLLALTLVGALLSGPVASQNKASPEKPVRGAATFQTITDERRERIAKIIAYSAGRLQEGESEGTTSREGSLTINNLDDSLQATGIETVTAKGDRRFHDQLEAESLRLLEEIDLDNGLQALLLQDKASGRAMIVFRGTEWSKGKWSDTIKDGKTDTEGWYEGEMRVGRLQYDAAREKLATWVGQHKGNVEVIGHSLGGALGQRLMIEHGKHILYGTFFNTPGLERDEIDKMVKNDTFRQLLRPDGTRKVRIYNAANDPVGYIGNAHILADIFLGSGGALETGLLATHNAMLFGPNTRRVPTSYYDLAAMRRFKGSEAGVIAGVAGLLKTYLLGEPTMMELLAELQEDERAWLRENDLTTADQRIGKARAALYMLDMMRQRREYEALLERQARRQSREPQPETTNATIEILPEPVGPPPGIYADFEGSMTGTGDKAYLDGGKFEFTIKDTKITGTMSGMVRPHGASSGGDKVSGTIDGRFNPVDGTVTAEIDLQAGFFSSLNAKVVGVGGVDGFTGDWDAPFLSGTWNAKPKIAPAITWAESFCANPETREYWIRQGNECPPE